MPNVSRCALSNLGGKQNSRVGTGVLTRPRLRSQQADRLAIWQPLPEPSKPNQAERASERGGAGRYLLGALGGLFGEVVVGVVSLRDAAEQHGHDACGKTHTHTWKTLKSHSEKLRNVRIKCV